MRASRILRGVLLGACLAAPAAGGDAKVNAGWERMKSLVGRWEGTAEGSPVTVTYKLVSNGTSLMETMDMPGESEAMITMYHPDGGELLATHYCAAGNQPRMRLRSAGDPGMLDFALVDATNVSDSTGEVMQRLVVTFRDADHFQQTWTVKKDGKSHSSNFVYTRKK
jgi:hypothetical protein